MLLCTALLCGSASIQAVDAAPIITSTLSADGTLQSPMAYQIVASNSPTTYTCGTPSVPLPTGLSFNSATGLISGRPTIEYGLFNLVITATNDVGTTQQVLALTIHYPNFDSPFFTSGAQISGTVGTPLTPFFTTNSFTGVGYSSRDLPLGLTFVGSGDGESGTISGTPTVAGTFNAVITVSNPVFPNPCPTNLVFTIAAAAGTTGTTTASSASASASGSGGASTSASSSATTTGTATAANLPVAVPSDNGGNSCGLGGSLGALLFVGLLLQIRSRRN